MNEHMDYFFPWRTVRRGVCTWNILCSGIVASTNGICVREILIIPQLHNVVRTNNKVCDACPHEKHTRISVPISENKAGRMFELIHLNPWVAYKTSSSCGARYFFHYC